jgi:hypothetical protein
MAPALVYRRIREIIYHYYSIYGLVQPVLGNQDRDSSGNHLC